MCHWDAPFRTVRGADGQDAPITRREFLAIKGKEAPKLDVSPWLSHYLGWFKELDTHYRPLVDGGMNPIGPWLRDWEANSGTLLGPVDRRILLAMDEAYRAGMSKIRADYMRHEQQRRERK